MVFKIDFEKPQDSLSCEVFGAYFKHCGFMVEDLRWRDWIGDFLVLRIN